MRLKNRQLNEPKRAMSLIIIVDTNLRLGIRIHLMFVLN